ncbi:hypothetical protein BDR03DRAFT_514903 [Suillus americanus]|nr:hypothetical protein BDR03DRAFT_514903 [Suillus americanus]
MATDGRALLILIFQSLFWSSMILPISRTPSGEVSDGQLPGYMKHQKTMKKVAMRRSHSASSVTYTPLVASCCIRGKKPEPPRESRMEPVHWEFIQQCWLPRASRPSVAEVVSFVGRELQALLS